MTGFGDPRFRVSLNLLGAPALSLKEFASYKQDLIVGVSLKPAYGRDGNARLDGEIVLFPAEQ